MAVIEIGIYKIHAGKRDEFVKLYDEELLPAQREFGFDVVGHFVSLDDEQTFVWLRRFSSREDRQRMTDEYYGGDLWRNELGPRALPLIEDYSNVIAVEPAPASAIQ
jgi:NIPSNAP